jgi:hypothetical protein
LFLLTKNPFCSQKIHFSAIPPFIDTAGDRLDSSAGDELDGVFGDTGKYNPAVGNKKKLDHRIL